MSNYGVTAAGFVTKRLSDIISDLETGFKGAFGDDLDVSASSTTGQEIGVVSKVIADLWEVLSMVAAGKSINGSEGANLEDVAFFRGIYRRGATKATSRVALIAKYGGTVLIPSGTKAKAPSVEGEPVFQLVQHETITPDQLVILRAKITVTPGAGQVFRISLSNIDGSGVFDAVYTAIDGDTPETVAAYLSARISTDSRFICKATNSDFEIVPSQDEYDFKLNSFTSIVIDEIGTAGNFQALEDGTFNGGSYSINQIVTPVSGLVEVSNIFDIRPGSGIENDTELRLRVLNAFSSAKAGTIDAVANSVRNVNGVSFCSVQENDSSVSKGIMPPHSIAIVADGELGIDEEVGGAIWASKPGGIETIGSTSVSVIDNSGNSQEVKFSRPVYSPAHVRIVVQVNPDMSRQADYKEKIQAAAVAIGSNYPMGVDMPAAAFYAAIYSVAGIGTATVEIGKGAIPVYTAGLLIVDPFERLQFDSSRIMITG